MRTDKGLHVKATRIQKSDTTFWRLDTPHRLFRFTPEPCRDVVFGVEPIFALRALISAPGRPHDHRILEQLEECTSSDPCLRLAIQYRLICNPGGSEILGTWRYAKIWGTWSSEPEVRLERIFKANTLAELLEGKTAKELWGVPRRSLQDWISNKKVRVAH